MFKEKFKSELCQIKPDSATKETIKKAMLTTFKKSPAKKTLIKLRLTAAVAAMLALAVVGVYFLNPQFNHKHVFNNGFLFEEEPTANDSADIEKPDSYVDIFNLFSELITDDVEEITDDVEDEYQPEYDHDYKGDSSSTKPGNTTSQSSNQLTTQFSTTNTQVEGIDESDVIKTDGKYIYTLKGKLDKVIVTLPENGNLTQNFAFDLKNVHINGHGISYKEIYVANDRLIALGETITENGIPRTVASIYNIGDPKSPRFVDCLSQTGSYVSSRLTNGVLYLFSNQNYNSFTINKENKKTYVPYVSTSKVDQPIPIDDIYLFDCEKSAQKTYLVASSIKASTAEFISHKAALGGGEDIYMGSNSLYAFRTVKTDYSVSNVVKQVSKTAIIRFEISSSGALRAATKGYVEGKVLNQFSLGESDDGFLRMVTTVTRYLPTSPSTNHYHNTLKSEIYNNLYILNGELEIMGSIENIAPDERIYSARLSGDVGYFVTYRLVDPLFAVDLADPQNPKILSKLKIPGFSEYLHSFGDGLLLGIGKDSNDREYLKLSMFDVSDPAKVTQKHYTILKNVTEYTVDENHKSVLISQSKNIIGFGGGNEGNYYIYSYNSNSGFIKKAVLKAPDLTVKNNRGLYIGDYLYLCGENGIISYSLSTFARVDSTFFN